MLNLFQHPKYIVEIPKWIRQAHHNPEPVEGRVRDDNVLFCVYQLYLNY